MIDITALKRIPLILVFLFLLFVAWVVSPFWVNHLPLSAQKALTGSTRTAKRVYALVSRESTPAFKPGHYNGVPKGASFIANFSVIDNVNANMVDHPTLKLNGNVITPPPHDTRDQFHIYYPGTKAKNPAIMPEAKWVAYLKAHPTMFVQVSKEGSITIWVMADKMWWTNVYSGKFNLDGATITQGSTSTPDDVGAKLSGDQGFTVPVY